MVSRVMLYWYKCTYVVVVCSSEISQGNEGDSERVGGGSEDIKGQ